MTGGEVQVQELLGATTTDPASPITALTASSDSQLASLPTDHVLHLELPGHPGCHPGDATVIVLLNGRTPMDRRLYIKTNLALPGIVVLGGPITGILDPDAQSTLANAWISAGKVGPEILAPLRALLAGCRRIDDVIGARHLIEPAACFIRMAAQLIPGATPEARKPLLSLAGEAAQFGAHLAMESDDYPRARQYHAQALEWAAAADDRTLAAYLWARQSLEARLAGDLPRALSASDAARAQATDAPAAVRALVERIAGRCYACAGNRDETARAFDNAATILDGADRSGEPDWIYWVSAEHITAERGAAYEDLGRGADALKVFSTALDALPPSFVRDRGHFLSYQANAYRLIGAVEDACEIAIQVVELARQTGSTRAMTKVRRIHAALTDTQRQTPEARLLHDVLQEAPPSR